MVNFTIQEIQQIVSNVTKVSVNEINSPSRKQNIVQARHLSMYFSRFNTKQNLLTIAKQHGRDNHATVIHACICIHQDRKSNKKLNDMYQTIDSTLNNQI